MAMAWVWSGMVVLSLLFGIATGTLDAVAAAVQEDEAGSGNMGKRGRKKIRTRRRRNHEEKDQSR